METWNKISPIFCWQFLKMNEWPLINVQYGNTFMISIIFLSNILCWYNIPMKSSVSIRSLASWRKCRCSTLLCASFIFSYKFYKLTVIILMTNAHHFSTIFKCLCISWMKCNIFSQHNHCMLFYYKGHCLYKIQIFQKKINAKYWKWIQREDETLRI